MDFINNAINLPGGDAPLEIDEEAYNSLPPVENRDWSATTPKSELARHRRILSHSSNKLCPPNPQDEDPYLVALLVALAQKQAQGQRLGDRDRDSINDGDARHKFCGGATNISSQMLLVTNPDDTTWLHIYTSNISPEFLDKFDRPSCPPPAGTDTQSPLGMIISRRRLAFEPYGTLSQRLAAVVQ
ncbi:hypothetical protein V8F33_013940 [Rhypophila sp. PSN 637]